MSIQSKDIAKLAAEALEVAVPLDGLRKLYEWLREPDWSDDDKFSLVDWVNGRPTPGWLVQAYEGSAPTAAPAIPTETGQGFSGGVGALAERFAMLSSRLNAIDTLPNVGDLYYAIKNEGAGTGWRYACSMVTASDIHDAARILSAIDIPAPAGGEEAVAIPAEQLGPRQIGLTCHGCPALEREYWKDYLDNDDTDSGTYNRCKALGGQMIDGSYGAARPTPPAWCPAPDHHLRVEVERLRAQLGRWKASFETMNATAVQNARERNAQTRRADANFDKAVEQGLRATTAETRIAEMEAVFQRWSNGYGFNEDSDEDVELRDRARSALASSNKPVEEGR